MIQYRFLSWYSDGELEALWQKQLEQGYICEKIRGNLLFYRRQHLDGARLLVLSSECDSATVKGDRQLNEMIDILLRQGWQLLLIGDLDKLAPIKRRLLFYSSDPNCDPEAVRELSASRESLQLDRAVRQSRGSFLLWLLISILCFFRLTLSPTKRPLLLITMSGAALAALAAYKVWRLRHQRYQVFSDDPPAHTPQQPDFTHWEKLFQIALLIVAGCLFWLIAR